MKNDKYSGIFYYFCEKDIKGHKPKGGRDVLSLLPSHSHKEF